MLKLVGKSLMIAVYSYSFKISHQILINYKGEIL